VISISLGAKGRSCDSRSLPLASRRMTEGGFARFAYMTLGAAARILWMTGLGAPRGMTLEESFADHYFSGSETGSVGRSCDFAGADGRIDGGTRRGIGKVSLSLRLDRRWLAGFLGSM